MKIFLSYNTRDSAFVEQIFQGLIRDGYDIFYDKVSLVAGDDWPTEIQKGIDESDAAIIFIGESGPGPWQKKEIITALSKNTASKSKPYRVIPVIVSKNSDVKVQKITDRANWVLTDLQWVEFRGSEDKHTYARLIKGLQASSDVEIPIGQNPYKGLSSFQVSDSPLFFGRTFELNDVFFNNLRLNDYTKKSNFLAIIGESGSGKSSFAQAGVLAQLKAGRYEGSDRWKHIVISHPSSDPLMNLSTTLVREGLIKYSGDFENRAINLSYPAKETSTNNDVLLRSVMEQDNTWVIYVDQFEEVLTQHAKGGNAEETALNERKRTTFLYNLAKAIESPKCIVIFSVRSDYVLGFLGYPEFSSLLRSNSYSLGQINLDEEAYTGLPDGGEGKNVESTYANLILREIISQPAANAGVELDRDLENRLINALKGVHGKLPLLQLTLDRLWRERGQDRKITLNHFAKISGNKDLAGVVKQHAEEIFLKLTYNSEDREILFKRIFVNHLVETGESKEDIRPTAKKSEIMKRLNTQNATQQNPEELLNELADNRLISIDGNLVNVVHEVIIREWPRLRGWVKEKRIDLRYRDRIEQQADTSGNGTEELLFGTNLTKALDWKKKNPDLLTEAMDELIFKSQKARKQKYKVIGAGLIILTIIILLGYKPYKKYQLTNRIAKSTNASLHEQWQAQGSHPDSIKSLNITPELVEFLRGELSFFPALQTISLSGLENENQDVLEGINSLQKLIIFSVPLTDFSRIYLPPNLDTLVFANNHSLQSTSGIEKIRRLANLNFKDNGLLVVFTDLSNIEGLEELNIISNGKLENISAVSKVRTLRKLKISGNSSLLNYPIFMSYKTFRNL